MPAAPGWHMRGSRHHRHDRPGIPDFGRRLWLAGVGLGLFTGPVQAGCLFFCDENDEVPPAQAGPALEAVLGAPLPPGLQVTGMIDGGFQDRFIQVRLRGSADGAAALWPLLGIDPATMRSPDGMQLTIAEADWWDVETRADALAALAVLRGFPNAWALWSASPDDPELIDVYLFAFQT